MQRSETDGKKEKKSKKILSWIFSLVFLSFIGIMDYPFLARTYNKYVQGNVVVGYEGLVSEKEAPELLRERERAQQYNRELSRDGVSLADAFAVAAEQENDAYEELLNPGGNGVMGILVIPGIGVRLPVYHGTEERVLQKGAGHLLGSALPVGGESTHCCISAHRGLPDKRMFTNLDQLAIGDCFFLEVLGETLAYRICGIETVRPEETEALAMEPGRDLVTLITCTPYGINTHRLYVHGERIPYAEHGAVPVRSVERRSLLLFLREYGWIGMTLLLLAWLGFLLHRFQGNDERGNYT